MALPSNYRHVAIMGQSTAINSPQRMGRTPTSIKVEQISTSPFTASPHGNPAFNPQKIGGGKTALAGEGRIPKPPKAPDKPLMPYMRYSRKVWDQVKAGHQDLKLWEIGKIIGSKWRDLPEADKQDYVNEYESEKLDYDKALKLYHESPSYKAYLSAKAKGSQAIHEDKDPLDRSSSGPVALGGVGGVAGGAAAATAASLSTKDRRFDIQPAEDEDDFDEGLSVKAVCQSRYLRNHRLINEVFSDTIVPDARTVVTVQRLAVLRKQMQSLIMHQKKLENELQQTEEKFEVKKRKFVEASQGFQADLKKVKATESRLDEKSFAQMVERQKENLRKEAEERQRAQQRPPPPSPVAQTATENAASPDQTNPAATNDSETAAAAPGTPSSIDAPSPSTNPPTPVQAAIQAMPTSANPEA